MSICSGCSEGGGIVEPNGYHATCYHDWVLGETIYDFAKRMKVLKANNMRTGRHIW